MVTLILGIMALIAIGMILMGVISVGIWLVPVAIIGLLLVKLLKAIGMFLFKRSDDVVVLNKKDFEKNYVHK